MEEKSREERDQAKQLAESVVVAQNNRFIKDLLRRKNLPIGSNKQDFEENLRKAIDENKVTLRDIAEWLAEVEGWGNQHVYARQVPRREIPKNVWSEEALYDRVVAAGLKGLWKADRALVFPETTTLTGIYFDGVGLQFVWHSGSDSWIPAPEKNIDPREEDGDLYKYKAYRSTGFRSVTRLEIRRDPPLAAVFMPDAWEEKRHEEVLSTVFKQVNRIMDVGSYKPLPISEVIKVLDARTLAIKGKDSSGLRSRSTRLDAFGAWVQFASSSGHDFNEFLPIRRVRNAVQPKDFVGTYAHFELVANAVNQLSRDVSLQLYGDQDRIRLWVAMKSTDVWTVLQMIYGASI